MSCSSATLLAPSVAFSENIIKEIFPHMSDRTFLRTMRTVLVCFAGVVLVFALNSQSSIFKMVENAYKVTLVAAFVPLCAGLYWSRATTQGALCAFVAGLMTWMGLELFGPSDSVWPPQLVGFLVAATGMVVGSLLPQKIRTREV
jgi:Na+/proline symporter